MADNLLATPAPRPTFSPRQIAAFYFKPCLDEEREATGYYACKTCTKRRKHKSCYSNLVSHVRAHPNYESNMRDASVAATGNLWPWVTQKVSNRYAWLRWVVTGNLPLSFCESKETRLLFAICIAADADIVHFPVFKRAVVKVLDDQASLLTDDGVSALDPFKRTQAAGGGREREPADKEGFAVRTLKRRKNADAPATYVLLKAIPPTSNIVERLFSVARAVLRHERHCISPMMLEMILFLKVNSSSWDVATVEQCLFGGGASGCKGKDGSAFVEMTSGGAVTPTDTVLCLVAKAAATQTKVGKDDIVSLDLVAYDVVLMLLLKGWSLLGALKEMSWSLVSWALMKVASVVSYVETMQSLFVMSTKV
eukprot:jgi/Phyca11/15626/fgenesh1_pg.PHYCAscaffold_14_\